MKGVNATRLIRYLSIQLDASYNDHQYTKISTKNLKHFMQGIKRHVKLMKK